MFMNKVEVHCHHNSLWTVSRADSVNLQVVGGRVLFFFIAVMASNITSSRGKSTLSYNHQDRPAILPGENRTSDGKYDNDSIAINSIQAKQEKTDWQLAQKLQQAEDKEQLKRLYALQFEADDLSLLMEDEEQEDSEEEEVQWITSHLNPEKIIWSSNPKVI
jgi:hypothetical protein